MDEDFNIIQYLESQHVEAPRRSRIQFLARKKQIYDAAKYYSLKQIWIVLRDTGKFTGSYNSFSYYFNTLRNKGKEDGKNLEEILSGTAEETPKDVPEKKEPAANESNFSFRLPNVDEKDL